MKEKAKEGFCGLKIDSWEENQREEMLIPIGMEPAFHKDGDAILVKGRLHST